MIGEDMMKCIAFLEMKESNGLYPFIRMGMPFGCLRLANLCLLEIVLKAVCFSQWLGLSLGFGLLTQVGHYDEHYMLQRWCVKNSGQR